jgi:hypothetical protein
MVALETFDELFLALDGPVTVGHMGALTVFDATAGGGPFTADSLIELLAARLERMPLLRRRPEPDPSRPGRHVWVDEDVVALERHVEAHHLDGGDDRALGRFAARLDARPLDRSRPVWEMHVLDGLDGGRVATLLKIHHALGDAAPARHVLETLFADDPDQRPQRPLASSPATAPRAASPPPEGAEPPRAPATRFNRPLGTERDFAFGLIGVERVERVRGASDATFNDVLVAAWAGALRGWLALRGETPKVPLLARVPISLRGPEEDDADAAGNRFAVVPVPIPSDEGDGAERLRRTTDAMAAAKRAATWAGGRGRGVNLSLSTPPASGVPLSWAGAPRIGTFVLAPLSGTGLSVVSGRYPSHVTVGVHVDAEQVPDPWSLLRAFDVALADLETVLAAA